MDAVGQQLVSEREGLIRLLAPAFADTQQDPGYIKGYVAGVRENGGQYTHAALWVVRALAELGDRHLAARLLAMLSPVTHTRDAESTRRYGLEPYLIAADVYGVAPHVGRGGWSGYTGAAGWMFRVAVESILGLTLEGGDTLVVRPCIPDEWAGYRADWRIDGVGTVAIRVLNPGGHSAAVRGATLDGREVAVGSGHVRAQLPRDGGVHELVLTLGPSID